MKEATGNISSLNNIANGSLQDAPAGVYFISITDGLSRYTGKLIIE